MTRARLQRGRLQRSSFPDMILADQETHKFDFPIMMMEERVKEKEMESDDEMTVLPYRVHNPPRGPVDVYGHEYVGGGQLESHQPNEPTQPARYAPPFVGFNPHKHPSPVMRELEKMNEERAEREANQANQLNQLQGDRLLESAGNAGDPPAPPPAKKKATGKRKGEYTQARFTLEELEDLMDIVEQILPIGPNQWEQVENDFNTIYPARMRTTDNLRRQFNKQCKKKAPTGDPNIPSYIRKAKNAQRDIIAKGNAVMLGQDSDTESTVLKDISNSNTKSFKASKSNSDQEKNSDMVEKKAPVKRQNKKSDVTSTTDAILQAFLASESAAREAQLRREEREARQEKLRAWKDRQREKRSDTRMFQMMQYMATVAAGLSGAKAPPVASMPNQDDSDSESDESASYLRWKESRKKSKLTLEVLESSDEE